MPTRLPANNGSVAMSFPVEGIVVDGDLQDWPSSGARYAIRRNLYGDLSDGTEDHQAWFRVGHDSAAGQLFLAVEVEDDSRVFADEDEATDWNSHDGMGFSITPNHGPSGGIGRSFGIRGGKSPSLIAANGRRIAGTSSQAPVVVAYRTDGNRCRYEWRIDLHQLDFDGNLNEPFTCSWSVNINDRDEDDSFSAVFWSPGTLKMKSAERLGDLIVGADPGRTGVVDGSLRLADGRAWTYATRIRYESLTIRNLVVDLVTQKGSHYTQTLPAGRYRRYVRDSWSETPEAEITVRAQCVTRDKWVLPHPPARTRPLGSGTTAMLGPGSRADAALVYSAPDHIAHGSIHSIVQDRRGQIWIGTERGLIRLASGRLTTFDSDDGLRECDIRTLKYDATADHLWIGTTGGLAKLDQTTEQPSLTHFSPLVIDSVRSLDFDHVGNLCVGTNYGLVVLDPRDDLPRRLTTAEGLPSNQVHSVVAEDNHKRSLIATAGGLVHWKNGQLSSIDYKPLQAVSMRVDAVFIDRRNTIWIVTDEAVWRFAPNSQRLDCALQFDHQSDDVVRSQVLQTRAGRMFVVTPAGLADVTPSQLDARPSITNSSPRNHLPPLSSIRNRTDISCIHQDSVGTLWMGTSTGTLQRVEKHLVRVAKGNYPCVSVAADGSVWAARRPGPSRVQVCQQTGDDPIAVDVALEEIPCLYAVDRDEAWVGSRTGVWRIDGQTAHLIRREGWPTGRVNQICRQQPNIVWMATSDGVYRIHGPHVQRHTSQRGLPSNDVYDIACDDQGRVFVATTHGLAKFEFGYWTRYNTRKGLSSNLTYRLCLGPENRLWVGTDRGLDCVDFDLAQTITHQPYRNAVLQNFSQGFIKLGHDGQFWMGTSTGLLRSDGEVFQPIGRYTGLGRAKVQDIAAGDACTWLATDQGLWRYERPDTPPSVILERVTTDRNSLGRPYHVRSTTDADRLAFHVRAISLSSYSDSVQYRHRLLGHSHEWAFSSDSLIEFQELGRGQYEFQIQAIDTNLLRSDLLTVDVHITPPYGRYLLTGLVIVAFSGCGLLGLSHLGKKKRLTDDLEQRLCNRTDEIHRAIRTQAKLKSALHQSQQLKTLGSLTMGVAHDFNNSLAAIITNAELANMQNRSESIHELLDEIIEVADAATRLTKSLLTVGRQSVDEKKPSSNLNELVCDGMKVIQRTMPASIEVELDIPEEPIYWCEIDGAQMHQVLMNIAVNARDAMSSGGRLRVELAGGPPAAVGSDQRAIDRHDDLDLSVATGAVNDDAGKDMSDMAVLCISDTGVGMSSEVRDRIFEPYFTQKSSGRGTGLGLSIVRAIVSNVGGSIDVQSRAGSGTQVTVRFPVSRRSSKGEEPLSNESSKVAARLPKPKTRIGSGLVLIADDQSSFLRSTARMIGLLGYDVVTAMNGRDCLTQFERLRETVDVILLDIDMPVMDGIECLRNIRRQMSDISVVLLTGMADHDFHQYEDESTKVLRKPFSVQALREALSR